MRIKLDFKSPLVIGGKRLSSNFVDTEDVIKGNILRAAFSKVILNNCLEKKEEAELVGDTYKKNWVYYRDGASCLECKYSSVCRKFSDLEFSFFYPINTEVIPLTSMVCKTNGAHGFIDILTEDPIKGCAACGSDSRFEFTSGLRKNHNKIKVPYGVEKSITTKTAINPYSKTSSDGKLYSIMAVSGTHKEKYENKIIYEGEVRGLTNEEYDLFKELRVGAYTSVGYGKCNVITKEDSYNNNSLEEISEFSEKYSQKYGELKDSNYIAIVFNGDCKVNFDFNHDTYYSTKELMAIWERALELPDYINIDKVYSELNNYRGYDNSLVNDDKREEAVTLIQKGSVIVFSTKRDIEELYNYLLDKNSFGFESNNGFGDFKLYLGGNYNDK